MIDLLTKNNRFLFLWTSQVLSRFSINLMNFLVLVYIFDKTGSTIASSLVFIAYGIPVFLLGPLAAAWVDASEKRKTIITTNLIQSAIILLYAIYYREGLFLSFLVVIFYSIADQFYIPAETSALTQIVKKKDLSQANSLFFISSQAAAIIGFSFSGVLREILGYSNAMILGTVLLFTAFVAARNLPVMIGNQDDLGSSLRGHINRMLDGFKFIKNKKKVYYPFILLIVIQTIVSILIVNLPVIGRDLLDVSSSYSGIVTMIPAGLGSILATYYISTVSKTKKVRSKTIVENSLLLATVVFISITVFGRHAQTLFGKALIMISFSAIGASMVTSLVPAVTFMQLNTPKKFMARVFGNYWFTAYSIALIPVLFSATITEIVGLRAVLYFLSAITASVYLFSKIKLNSILKTI